MTTIYRSCSKNQFHGREACDRFENLGAFTTVSYPKGEIAYDGGFEKFLATGDALEFLQAK